MTPLFAKRPLLIIVSGNGFAMRAMSPVKYDTCKQVFDRDLAYDAQGSPRIAL
jgi:hypothetical protein